MLKRNWKQWPLLNVWADDLTMDELLAEMGAGRAGIVFTINPDHLYHLQYNPKFLEAYRKADIITVDSHYVRLGLRLVGRKVVNRLPGSDIVPAFYERHGADPAQKIFLLGAKPGVAMRALQNINRKVGRELVIGAHSPSMRFVDDAAEIDAVIDMINASGANVLLVGLGAPKQELWLANHRHRMPGVKTFMGIGATIDYEAGEVKRAPPILRKIGLEWSYRVFTEPGRYLMRYVKNARFVWWILKDGMGLYRNPFSS